MLDSVELDVRRTVLQHKLYRKCTTVSFLYSMALVSTISNSKCVLNGHCVNNVCTSKSSVITFILALLRSTLTHWGVIWFFHSLMCYCLHHLLANCVHLFEI